MLSLAILFAIYCLALLAVTLLFLWYILHDLFNRIVEALEAPSPTAITQEYPTQQGWLLCP